MSYRSLKFFWTDVNFTAFGNLTIIDGGIKAHCNEKWKFRPLVSHEAFLKLHQDLATVTFWTVRPVTVAKSNGRRALWRKKKM